jgi:hypothetical protein
MSTSAPGRDARATSVAGAIVMTVVEVITVALEVLGEWLA